MGLLSRFFGDSTQRELERKYAQVQKDTEVRIRPLRDIATAIVKASDACFKNLKPYIKAENDKERQKIEVSLFYEFIYYFMHITNRVAFSLLTENQMQELQEYLGVVIVGTAIDTFFAHFPEDMKQKLRSDFHDRLNGAEAQYAASKELLSKDKPFTGDALASVLARNITEVSGNAMDIALMTEVIDVSTRCLFDMKLDQLVQQASSTLQTM